MSGGGRKTLKTLIGTYPHTAPLKSSALRSDRLDFEFTEIVPVWDGFKGMIRDDKYDVSEMAVVTYLLAKAHGKPLALLPAAMVGRFQHPYAIYNASKGPMTPADLKGKRVGIRSFTTTTGAWIRGILANDYGVDLDSIQWVTFEEPHVAEYKDTTQRAREGKKIVPMLLDGELDAVLGESSDDPRIKSLFGDPQAEAQRWYAKHKVVPINHLVVMRCARRRGGSGRRPRSLSVAAGGQAVGRPGSNSGHNSVRCRSQPAEPRDDCGVCVPAAPAAAPGLG